MVEMQVNVRIVECDVHRQGTLKASGTPPFASRSDTHFSFPLSEVHRKLMTHRSLYFCAQGKENRRRSKNPFSACESVRSERKEFVDIHSQHLPRNSMSRNTSQYNEENRNPASVELEGLQPRCDGPKLHPFHNRRATIRYTKRLSDPNHDGEAHVFQVEIARKAYALKVVSAVLIPSGRYTTLNPRARPSSNSTTTSLT